MSLMMQAPAATAAAITAGFAVSIEMAMLDAAAMPSMTGTTRASSSASSMGSDPGRLDSPPTSIMVAPSATMRAACATAKSTAAYLPPSENESGVTFRTPMTTGRERSMMRFRQRHCIIVVWASQGRDWEGFFRTAKNRMFFPETPGMDSRRSGKGLPNPDFNAAQQDLPM